MPLRSCWPACFLALVAACSSAPLSPNERRELELAEARWAQHGGLHYTVESRILCFCPPDLTQWTRLTVEGGEVVAADAVEPALFPEESSLSAWRTVEELFETLRNHSGDYLKDLEVTFDATLGYPLKVNIICDDNVQDCGTRIELRNLTLSP